MVIDFIYFILFYFSNFEAYVLVYCLSLKKGKFTVNYGDLGGLSRNNVPSMGLN
jgi:hypothetical protein